MTLPLLQIDALRLQLSGCDILNGISMAIERGEYVSIIGPNGAGKTTLMKCIAGLHRKWSGSITLHGHPLSSYGAKARARILSYVPQAEGRMIPLRVEEFVALGRYPYGSAFASMTSEDREAIETALQQSGLMELRHRTLNTLSGGERQMAFIAAALAQQAQLLLLDEPSTFLDYRHQVGITRLLERVRRELGITIIAVHHDINTAAASSSRIYALREGMLAFEGTPGEVLDTEVLQRIYGTAFALVPSPHRAAMPYAVAGGLP